MVSSIFWLKKFNYLFFFFQKVQIFPKKNVPIEKLIIFMAKKKIISLKKDKKRL